MKTLVRRIIMLVLLIIVLIRPTIPGSSSNRESTNLNIWFVVDASGSMVAKDVEGNAMRRFEKVQEDVSKIVERIPGARYSAIVQDYSTYTAVPITSSADSIIAALPYFNPKYSFYSQPSNLSELLSYTSDRIFKYKGRFPERNNVVIFMSDGEDVSGEQLSAPDSLANLSDYVAVLGYGTTYGTPMEEVGGYDENGKYSYTRIGSTYITFYGSDVNVNTDSKNRVLTKINEDNLKTIASQTGGEYYHRESDSVPDALINKINSTAKIVHNDSSSSVSSGFELYWIFALALLALLAWEGEELLTRILEERSK